MKTKWKYLSGLLGTVLLAFTLLAGPVIMTGCKNLTVQTKTFNTLATVAKAVDVAKAAYFDMVVSGKISTDSFKIVVPAYQAYQSSMFITLSMAQGNTNAVATAAVTSAATAAITAFTTAK